MNRYFVFILNNIFSSPFFIRCCGAQKMVIQHDSVTIKIMDSRGFNYTKSEFMSIISRNFGLNYIKKYSNKCVLFEVTQDDFKNITE